MVHIDHLVLRVENLMLLFFLAFIASYDPVDGTNLHMVEPSGHV